MLCDGFVARTRHLRSLRERLPEQPHKSEEQGRAGHLIDAEVKRTIEVIYLAGSSIRIGELLVVGLKLADVLVGDLGGSQGRGEAFEDCTYLVLFPRGTRLRLDDRRPFVGVIPEEALRFEPSQRLADRGGTDAEAFCQVALP